MSDDCVIVPRPLKLCNEPSPPVLDCSSTRIFGAPLGRQGRVPPVPQEQITTPIEGIAVHCLHADYKAYLNQACAATKSFIPCEHASMHYVIDALTGQITCLVKETDVAWAFQSYLSNFPLANPTEPYPGWIVLADQYPTLSADYYTINIGIAIPVRPQNEILDNDECCDGPFGMTWAAYHKLVQLTAWIAFRHEIDLDTQHIAWHDQIAEVKVGCEECGCVGFTCFICDVSSYCEGCKNIGDPTFSLHDDIAWIYGENSAGCRVKISLSDLITLLGV